MDPLETLLNLVIDEIEDAVIFNSTDGWTVLGYWRDPHDGVPPEVDGHYELEAQASTLRAALCAAIAHPRFAQ